MDYTTAKKLADGLLREIAPYCVRAEIAGSIRRGKETDIKDVELVVIPEWQVETDLFGEPTGKASNVLFDEWASRAGQPYDPHKQNCSVQWIKPGVAEIVPWRVKPDGKYWRGLVGSVKLDLFLTTPQSWGIIYLIRTGSADFSQAVVTHAKQIGRPVEGGRLTIGGLPVDTPDELTVFNLLGLRPVIPENRNGWDDCVKAAAQ